MVEVRFTDGNWNRLAQELLTRRDVESKCFMLCRPVESSDDVLLLVREVVPIPDSEYVERSAGRVVISRTFVHSVLVRCSEGDLSLLEAHTHPWATNVRFSSIDNDSDPKKFRVTECMSPPFRHASLVFGGDLSFEGRLWDFRKQLSVPIGRIKVLSSPLQIKHSSTTPSIELDRASKEVYDRQIRAFGDEGQTIVSGLTVGIIGLGGQGSQIAQALSLLGVGHLVLVDPDNLEESNANRVVGVDHQQISNGISKVQAIASTINRTCKAPPQIEILQMDVREPDVWNRLAWCDIIVGAVDKAFPRQFLNALSVRCLIPYLDAGVGIMAHAGVIKDGGGQVKVILPGSTFCLACLIQDTAALVQEQLTPGQREHSIRAGYIQGEQIHNPQVVFLNGVMANLLVWELVKLATGCLPTIPYVYYDLIHQKVYPCEEMKRRSDCIVCGDGALLGEGCDGLADFGRQPVMPLTIPAPTI